MPVAATLVDANVRSYLSAIVNANKPKPRGRRPNTIGIDVKLTSVRQRLESETDAIKRLLLNQEIIDLEERKKQVEAEAEMSDPTIYEAGFIEHAGAYAEANGISAKDFRAMGVPAKVIREAGIK